uniref:ABC transporter substrate-binding protein n=1 Tax=Lapillicoccus sp. TaxID=1909287 RepID=UPI0025D0A9B1
MKRNPNHVGIAFVGVTLVVAGCAPGTGSSSSGSTGSGKGTVKMVLWPGPEGDAMSKVVAQYNAGQGATDGVKVDMTLLSRQDTFSKEATLMAAKSSDQDIYFVASYNVGQFAASLDPLTTIDASNYFPVAVDGLKYQDKQYALPLDVSNHFLIYRKDLVDAVVNDPSQKAAYEAVALKATGQQLTPKPAAQWSWMDFQAMAAYFTKGTNPTSPTKYGTILQAKNLLYNTMVWDDVLWGMGG